MHDIAFANQVFSALENAKLENGMPIHKDMRICVSVRLSPFCHITKERLAEEICLLAKEKGFQRLSLRINMMKIKFCCRKCWNVIKSTKPVFKCASCGSEDFDINLKEEFCIDSIKIADNSK